MKVSRGHLVGNRPLAGSEESRNSRPELGTLGWLPAARRTAVSLVVTSALLDELIGVGAMVAIFIDNKWYAGTPRAKRRVRQFPVLAWASS